MAVHWTKYQTVDTSQGPLVLLTKINYQFNLASREHYFNFLRKCMDDTNFFFHVQVWPPLSTIGASFLLETHICLVHRMQHRSLIKKAAITFPRSKFWRFYALRTDQIWAKNWEMFAKFKVCISGTTLINCSSACITLQSYILNIKGFCIASAWTIFEWNKLISSSHKFNNSIGYQVETPIRHPIFILEAIKKMRPLKPDYKNELQLCSKKAFIFWIF